MKLADSHPQLIAAAIAATGVLFMGASMLELPFLLVEPPGAYILMGIAVFFISGGGYFLIKARRGELKPSAITVTDVRKQAIEKMESPELLSRIAQEDPKPEVRKKAMQRLEEITA
jgi:hypothetical protein